MRKIEIKIGGLPVVVEVAETSEDRTTGLSGRPSVPPGTGMLFVYERPRKLSFWMVGTLTPLSVAFLDDDGIILKLVDMAKTSTSDSKTGYGRAALEVPLGWFRDNRVSAGDQVEGCPWREASP